MSHKPVIKQHIQLICNPLKSRIAFINQQQKIFFFTILMRKL